MILVVSLNPALDITHHVAGVDWSGVNRPQQVGTAPGGKGLNVARTLHALGAGVRVVGLAGGIVGEAVAAGLAAAGVAGAFTPIAGQTRRTCAVVDTASHGTALFNEPGPAVTAGEYQRFLVLYENSLAGCDAVVLSGSLPPGLPEDSYAGLAAWPPARRSPSRTWPNCRPRCAGHSPAWPPSRPPRRSCGPREPAPWWCRSAVTVCSRSPARGPGTRRRRPRWRGTRPAPVTPWSPVLCTGWCSAGRGPSGCGMRRRSAPRASRLRPRGSSPRRTTGGRWPGPRSPSGRTADAGRRDGRDRRPRGCEGPGGRRVQHHRYRARRGGHRRGGGRRGAGGAGDQPELRGLPRGRGTDRAGRARPGGGCGGARRGAPGPCDGRGPGAGRGGGGRGFGDVRRVLRAVRTERGGHGGGDPVVPRARG